MEYNKFIHNGLSDISDVGRGSLLLAQPLLKEPYFTRSAILVLDCDPKGGYLGLALNRQSVLTMADIVPDWDQGCNLPLYAGGPVDQGRLFLLHTLGPMLSGAAEIFPGMYVGGSLKDLLEYIQEGGTMEGHMRFFVGYCGWESRQLEAEIKAGEWAVSRDIDPSRLLSGSEDEYWRREVARMGELFRPWLQVPEDPSLN